MAWFSRKNKPEVKTDISMGVWFQRKNPSPHKNYKCRVDNLGKTMGAVKDKKGNYILEQELVFSMYVKPISIEYGAVRSHIFNLKIFPKKELIFYLNSTSSEYQITNDYELVTSQKLITKLDCLIAKDAKQKDAIKMRLKNNLEKIVLQQPCE